MKTLKELVGLLGGEEQVVSGEKGDGVHEQGDPKIFGRQLGPEQGVEQGCGATVVSLVHHPTTRVRNKVQDIAPMSRVTQKYLGASLDQSRE